VCGRDYWADGGEPFREGCAIWEKYWRDERSETLACVQRGDRKVTYG